MAKAPKAPKEQGEGKSWKQLKKRTSRETLRNREVFDNQQLERTKIEGKQTMTSRAIIAGVVGVVTTFSVWSVWSVIDQARGALDKHEIKYEEITEPASEVPRSFTDLEYVNMSLEKSDYYASLGYDYIDTYTKKFYTEAEYRQWVYAMTRLESGEFRFATKFDEKQNRYIYVERTPMDPVDPSSVRSEITDAEWLAMQLIPAKLYDDVGYTWGDVKTHRFYTQGEYEKWISVLTAADEAYSAYYEEHKTNPDAQEPQFVPEKDADGNYKFELVAAKITVEQYLANKFPRGHYLRISRTKTEADGTVTKLYGKAEVHDDGSVWVIAQYDNTFEQWNDVTPTEITSKEVLDTLQICYNAYSWYDIATIAEKEVITEKASSIPREYSDIEWANMYLVKDSTYERFGYTWLDIRTGKYYTEAEFASFLSVQNRLQSRELLFWRENNPKGKGYLYYEEAPLAPETVRDDVKKLSSEDWLGMQMKTCSYEPWASKGWVYIDLNTMLTYTEQEHALYDAVMAKVESGEIKIEEPEPERSLGDYMINFTVGKFFVSVVAGFAAFGLLYQILKRNLDAQNLLNDTSDINQWENDQHIATPEEIQRKFDWFPDVGAHSPVQVSSMVSHMMLNNKGLNPIELAERAKSDIIDADGDVEYYKGEILLDDEGNPKKKKVPLIDMDFGEDLFVASGNPKDIRRFYDTTKIPYNPGGRDRTKQAGEWDTVAEMINNTWTFPDYEPQRPAGAYLVDTEPVNTMVLAITRAGKGKRSPACSAMSKSSTLSALNSQRPAA